jgi:hypothetical protein
VRSVTDGELVQVNPVTTLADAWDVAEQGRSLRRGRNVVERLLGIKRVLDDGDLFATDRWFDGDAFHRWTLERGTVGAGVRTLVRRIDRPGFHRRVFRPRRNVDADARLAASPGTAAANVVLDGLLDHVSTAASATGPQGVVLGLALKALKALVGEALGAEKEVDQVKVALDEIAERLAQLKAQLGASVFQLQVDATRKEITKIEAAQKDLRWALTLPLSAGEGRKEFAEATDEFLKKAARVEDDGVALYLHNALTDTQPEGAPALLPGVRRKLGEERFFTNESSQRSAG